jgi:outer membrane receptor protein involved in Fe transport
MKYINGNSTRTLLMAGASASALLLSGAGIAQDSNQNADDDNVFDEIVVTGSRIKSSNITAQSPLQVIDSDFIQDQAVVNIQDALQINPAFGIAGASRQTSNTNITTVGSATVNLRNLGANRTLVLVDGKRMIAGRPGTTQVDLSMIPTDFVERVEVLTGGASAVYGSDAVAGVVNLIYKRDFEGLVFNAQSGISEEGDDEQYKLDMTAGYNFADGRGNFMIHAGWSKQGLVSSENRERTSDSFYTTGDNPDTLFEGVLSRSGVITAGVVTSGGVNYTFDDAGNAVVWGGTQEERFNGTPYRAIASPVNRLTFATRASFEVSDKITTFMEANYARVTSKTYFEPSPFVSGANNIGVGAVINAENYILNPSTGETTLTQNPFLPQILIDNAVDSNGDGLRDVSLNRRLSQFGSEGTRLAPVEREMFRIVMGAEGDLNENWSYDVHYSYGRTKLAGRMEGLFHQPNLLAALTVGVDVYDLDADGDTTDAICVDPNARARGCVPADMYGEGSMTEEMLAYVEGTLFQDSVQDMHVVSANLSGTVFELPAGPVQVAGGIEYRNESSAHLYDPLTNRNQNGYVQLTNTVGSQSTKEAYAEVNVPLISDAPFAKSLSVRGAARMSDYSTVGSFWAYNGGVEWSPIDDLRIRAVYAHAVRAPNIGELFAAPNAGITSINDPCNGVTATSSGTVDDNCRAAPGVLENINANGGVFTLTFSDENGVGSLSANNPDIGEETATTYTIGAVYSPSEIPGFVFTVDYFNIDLKDAISRVNASTVLNKCYEEGLSEFCEFVSRRSTAAAPYSSGSVDQVIRGLVNSGGSWAEGIDFTANYSSDLDSVGLEGMASVSVSWTHLISKGNIPLTGEPENNAAGEIGDATNRAFIALNYDNGPIGVAVTGRYIGASYLDDDWVTGRFDLPAKSDEFKVGAKFYTDLQVQYRFKEHYELYIGARNLFNVDPAPLIGGLPGGNADTGTNSGVYDAIGRRFYAGFRASF